jgi:predicted O-methyltransferase YrrM
MSSNLSKIESIVTDVLFNELSYLDQRERDVFEEYLYAFSFLFYNSKIKQIIEIGAGHSTLVFSLLAKRTGCEVKTIDMNPQSMINKLRNRLLVDDVVQNIKFINGTSISNNDLLSFYKNGVKSINGININEVMKYVDSFIDLKMDNRKEPKVKLALCLENLNSLAFLNDFDTDKLFSTEFLEIYRSVDEDDEFSFCEENNLTEGVLASLFEDSQVDMVFLDSGEFSSLVEWEIISKNLRIGGYVYLHDIFFPKSYKNWLVCASIKASKHWEVLYINSTIPQGMMLAKKVS